jgi:hypothetical protein
MSERLDDDVLLRIVEHCDRNTLGSLRFVSRFPEWAASPGFFKTLVLRPTKRSVNEVFIMINSHRRWREHRPSHHVQELEFSIDGLWTGDGYTDNDTADVEARIPRNAGSHVQWQLQSDPAPRPFRIIKSMIRRLKNVRTISIRTTRTSNVSEDFSGDFNMRAVINKLLALTDEVSSVTERLILDSEFYRLLVPNMLSYRLGSTPDRIIAPKHLSRLRFLEVSLYTWRRDNATQPNGSGDQRYIRDLFQSVATTIETLTFRMSYYERDRGPARCCISHFPSNVPLLDWALIFGGLTFPRLTNLDMYDLDYGRAHVFGGFVATHASAHSLKAIHLAQQMCIPSLPHRSIIQDLALSMGKHLRILTFELINLKPGRQCPFDHCNPFHSSRATAYIVDLQTLHQLIATPTLTTDISVLALLSERVRRPKTWPLCP